MERDLTMGVEERSINERIEEEGLREPIDPNPQTIFQGPGSIFLFTWLVLSESGGRWLAFGSCLCFFHKKMNNIFITEDKYWRRRLLEFTLKEFHLLRYWYSSYMMARQVKFLLYDSSVLNKLARALSLKHHHQRRTTTVCNVPLKWVFEGSEGGSSVVLEKEFIDYGNPNAQLPDDDEPKACNFSSAWNTSKLYCMWLPWIVQTT